MNLATLIVWLVTAVGGLILVGIFLSRGGLQTGREHRFPRPLPFAHALLAVASLVLFLIWWANGSDALKPIVLVGLLLTAVLGIWMFVLWLGKLRVRLSPSVGAATTRPAEDSFPTVLVALHGILAVSTLVLYIVAAFIVAS
ncbi:MAG TPA: hypothetical protein VFU72_08875 [Nitrolancea sp.]|nr:hypothetical protein [Nitrolancea sp.]